MSEDNRAFSMQKIYVKDMSFESPRSPEIFTQDFQPQLNVDLNTEVNKLGEEIFEIVLHVTATVQHEDQAAFLIEVQQAGIFSIEGFPDEEMGPLLGAYCPTILFPYARETVSDIVGRGGFPQLLLEPVNFDMLYAQQVEKQQASAQ